MEWILNCIVSAMPVVIGPVINVSILSNHNVKNIFYSIIYKSGKKPVFSGVLDIWKINQI